MPSTIVSSSNDGLGPTLDRPSWLICGSADSVVRLVRPSQLLIMLQSSGRSATVVLASPGGLIKVYKISS